MSESLNLPKWAQQVRHRYEGGVASVFCLHGNIRDLQPFGNQYLPLPNFVVRAFTGGKQLVLFYSIRTGLTFADPAMEREFCQFLAVHFSLSGDMALAAAVRNGTLAPQVQDLFKNPSFALPLLQKLLETRDKVALIIEDAETLAPNQELAFLSMDDRRNIAILRNWAENPKVRQKDNFVFWLTENLSDLNSRLRTGTPHLDLTEIPYPNYEERLSFIQSELAEAKVKLHDLTLEQFAHLTAGLNLTYIRALIMEAKKSGEPLTAQHVRRRKEEIFHEEYGGLIKVHEPEYGLDMVAGLEPVKRLLRLVALILRSGNRQDAPMGIGFVGPPGTGKTYIVKAFAKEVGLPLVEVGNVREMWVGASERNADKVIALLRSMVPVIVLYDEIDQAYGRRGEIGDSGVSQRLWAKFSTFMADTSLRGLMLTVWATNRPDLVDEAIKRPDRAGDIKIPLFFAAEDPEAVLRINAQKRGFKLEEFDFSPIIEKVKGFSPAELNAVLTQARWFALEDNSPVITFDHLMRAATTYTPSRNEQMIAYMEALAALECTDQRLLVSPYSEMSREELMRRTRELRFELASQGLL
ncbi:MAG: AAA family ATPase [Armatimonadota bacterium]